MPDPLVRALAAVDKAQRRLDAAEAKAAEASVARDRAVLAAQVAGASYADLQAATTKSQARIVQILRRARGTDQPAD